MRYSISMYRGGFQVDVETCDHTSAKNLGLICPFCKEAVFYRSGSKYVKDSKEISVKPSFVHYAIEGDELTAGVECENRAKRQDGIDYLKRLEIESKNQRLKLYNDHLWEIVNLIGGRVEDANKRLKQINKTIPQKYRNLFVLESRKLLVTNKDIFREHLHDYYLRTVEDFLVLDDERFDRLKRRYSEGHSPKIGDVDNPKITGAIHVEIFDFLLSKSGQVCLSKMLLLRTKGIILSLFDGATEKELFLKKEYKEREERAFSTEFMLHLEKLNRDIEQEPEDWECFYPSWLLDSLDKKNSRSTLGLWALPAIGFVESFFIQDLSQCVNCVEEWRQSWEELDKLAQSIE